MASSDTKNIVDREEGLLIPRCHLDVPRLAVCWDTTVQTTGESRNFMNDRLWLTRWIAELR